MKIFNFLLLTTMLSTYSHFILANEENELCQEGNDLCTFVLLSESNLIKTGEKSTIHNVNNHRANLPLSPFSTFKIANSLIGLDLGIIQNSKQTLTFDKKLYPEQPWWPPVWKLPQYDLTSAFKYSMVPIYRQLAKNIGEKDMLTYLKKLQYGNKDISSGLDDFWLNGSIKISAIEQVLFLQKVYHNQFEFNAQTIEALKEIMLVETKPNYRLYAKTGAGNINENIMLGWYVGFVENSAGVHFFAFNFDSPNYTQMKKNRIKIAVNHLKLAGIIE